MRDCRRPQVRLRSFPSQHDVGRVAAGLLMAGALACTGAVGTERPDPGLDDGSGGKLTPSGKNESPATPPPAAPSMPAAVGSEFSCRAGTQDPGPSLVRRLTVTEYLNSVRDLTGVELRDLAGTLPADHEQDGFTNDAAAQTIVLDHIETYARLADEVVKRLPDQKAFVERHAKCTTFGDECENAFIDSLGLRFFRRPPDERDRAALRPLFLAVRNEAGTFTDGAVLVVTAMLQSPRFLYRIEVQQGPAGVRKLDDHELATRLSYLFWGSTPDEALLAAAGKGALRDEAELRRQVERLSASEAARRQSLVFLSDWLRMPRLDDLQTPLAADMRAETQALFERVVWTERQPLPTLLGATTTTVSEALAKHYGLPSPRTGVQSYDVSKVPGRRGLLGHGTVLSAGGEDASLVNRGLFVLEAFLCSTVPPPPVGVNNGRPDTEPGKPQRFYAEQRASTAPCSNCHSHLDPLAFPLEAFTGLGVPRTRDEKGNTIATDGVLKTPYDPQGRPFKDADEFGRLLAADERVADCLVLKPAQFALGRALVDADACTLAAVRSAVEGEGVRYQDVLASIALQPSFRQIRTESE